MTIVTASEIQKALISWLKWIGGRLILPNVYVKGSPWESDVVSVTAAYYWSEYEIKISLDDFRQDFCKIDTFGKTICPTSILKHAAYASAGEINSHHHIIPKPKNFWFVVPGGLLDDEVVPEHCGIVEYGLEYGHWRLKWTRPAPTLRSATKLDQAAIFNLAQKAAFRLACLDTSG